MAIKNKIQKITHRIDKNKKKSFTFLGLFIFSAVMISTGIYLITKDNLKLNYKNILDVIANGESKGNYNAYFGNSGNKSIIFTEMTVDEVLKWQDDFVNSGKASSAVGRYQFINTTLRGLVAELEISGSEKFNEELQDKLAIQLLHRRGIEDFARGKISQEEFANNLSKEWAALPQVIGKNPDSSFYDGDGLNKAQVSVANILAAIQTVNEVA